jgi:signal transduction histidine kinase
MNDLPVAAKALLAGVVGSAVVLAAVVTAADPAPLRVLAVLALAAGIAAGEALRIDLPYRRGGNATFTLGDAALAAGLLVLPGTEVVAGAALGIAVWQVAERVAIHKLVFNVAQYMAGTGAAALAIQLLAPRPGEVDPHTLAALALALGLFLGMNVSTVSGMIALTSGGRWREIAADILRTAGLIAGGNAAFGLLAVLLAAHTAWALPALGVPLVLLYLASRQAIRAQVDRRRSVAFVTAEQRLGEATTVVAVAEQLALAAGDILGLAAAVWRDERWVTPVPPGTGACPVDARLERALVASGPALGPATTATCAAIGLGEAVLVVWRGELGIDKETAAWLERLGRSGRASFARAHALGALRRERATLRAVVDGTGDGILVVDMTGTVRLWNPAMGSLASVAPGDALGCAITDVLGAGPWLVPGVHDVTRPLNNHVWRVSVAQVSGSELGFGDGDMCVAAIHDVTSERRLARMKDDMMAVVSHELRTPLTPIKASAQLLRRRWDVVDPEARTELLANIEERADHLARLVEDLLLVGQLSAAGQTGVSVSLTAVNLSRVVRAEAEQLALSHDDHEFVCDAADEVHVAADPLRLRQVVDNLVENACKFSPPGTQVRLGIHQDGDTAVLVVSDQGRGIPLEDQERIFERFERVEDPLVMTTGGAGLGLYIVRALVQAMRGQVSLSSAPGRGTTVMVRLPLAAAPAHAADGEMRQREGRSSSSRMSSSDSPPSS